MLKHLVHLGRYTDFMLRLNPFVVRLQTVLLDNALNLCGLGARDLIVEENGQKRIRPDWIQNRLPELLSYMENAFNGPVEERPISIWLMNVMLSYLGVDESVRNLLEDCERGNRELRNSAAHELFAITNDDIRNICGSDAKTLIGSLEKVLIDVLAHYGDQRLKRRINIYDRCDEIISKCL